MLYIGINLKLADFSLLKQQLSKQLLLQFSILLFIVGIGTLSINYFLTQSNLQQQVQKQAQSITQGIEFSIEALIEAGRLSLLKRIVQNYATLPTVLEITVIDPNKRVIASSHYPFQNKFYPTLYPKLDFFLNKPIEMGIENSVDLELNHKSVLVQILPFSSPIFDMPGKRGAIIVLLDLNKIRQEAQYIFFNSTLTLLLGNLLILFFMALLIRKQVLSPLYQLHQTIDLNSPAHQLKLPPHLPNNEIKQLGEMLIHTIQQLQDQERLKRERLQAEQAQQAAELANQTKSNFLANMSHELRTPLNGILGYTQILKRDPTLTPKQQEGIHIIQYSGEYLLTLINDILDLSELETGQLLLHSIDFNFQRLIDQLLALFHIRAIQKDIAFNYQSLSQLPIGLRTDEKRLRQILVNLLSNALKFTKQGGVTLKIGYEQDFPDPSQSPEKSLRFQIEDTGIGIAPQDLERIFLPFQQASTSYQKAEGTGLGLAISQRLIHMMGGQLQVKSTLGKGSTFWFTLTLHEISELFSQQEPTLATPIGFRGKPKTILIIDDCLQNRSLLINSLTPLGFLTLESPDGLTGLNLACQHQPDLIITDLVMPILDGFETTRQMRKIPSLCKIPIIATSASVLDISKQQSLEAGCNLFLHKPIQLDLLFQQIQTLLNLEWIYEKTPPSIPLTSTPKHTSVPPIKSHTLLKPTPEQAELLFELAMMGDIHGILEEIDKLQANNPELLEFTQTIRQLAKGFKEKQLCEFIEYYLK